MQHLATLLSAALTVPVSMFAATAGMPVNTGNVITTHNGFVVPAGLTAHVAAVPTGQVQGIYPDGRFIGDRMSGKVGFGGSLSYEAGNWTLSAGDLDWSILWGYSVQQVNGKPVFTLDVAWNYFALSSNASVPVDYIDMGLTDVQLVDALLSGQITHQVFDAIAHAAVIRRNAPEHKQYLLNILVQMSYARYASNYYANYMVQYYWAVQMGQPPPTYNQLQFSAWWASQPQALVIIYPTIFVEYVP
jgi:hypothetical protein